MKRISIVVLLTALWGQSAVAQDGRFKISGFSEVRYNSRFGAIADEKAFDDLEASGGESHDSEKGSGITFPGFNLNLLSELSEKLYFQGELNFAYEDADDLHLELYRAYLDYRLNSKFNLQAGKFLTGIGYLNRNQRIYGYLNNSIVPRDMVFEEFGYMPSFMMGLQAYGTFEGSASSIKYMIGYGAMRGSLPHGATLSIAHIGDEEESAPGFTGLLEWYKPTENGEINIGFSAYSNPSIKTNYVATGEVFDELNAVAMELKETGIAPYLRVDHTKFQFIGEFHSVSFKDATKVSAKENYSYTAMSAEFMYKAKMFNKGFGPYVRYDMRSVDANHPFYGLVAEHEGPTMSIYNTEQSKFVVGFVFDPIPANRIKMEYGANMKGVGRKGNFSISTSFAF